MEEDKRHRGIIHATTYGPEMYGPDQRLAILCEGNFNPRNGKTAYGILRLWRDDRLE